MMQRSRPTTGICGGPCATSATACCGGARRSRRAAMGPRHSHPTPRVTLARVIEWLPAAAALVLAVLFRWLAANQQQMVDAHFTPVPPIYQTVSEIEDAPR